MRMACVARAVPMAAIGVVSGLAGAWMMTGGTTAIAHRAAMKPEASTVGVVDLTVVMKGLDEAAQLRKRLEDAFSGFQGEIKVIGDEIKTLKDELDAMKDKSTQDALRKMAKVAELEVTGRARAEGLQRLLEIQEADLLRTMFKKIVESSKRLAEQQGYDVVLADDRGSMPPEGTPDRRPTARDVNDVVLSRRVLAIGAAKVDVTQQLIDLMNNEFKAGK